MGSMKSQGQISLEYLLVLGAFFSILLVMAPFIGRAFDLGKHHFEVSQAKRFLLELESKARELQVFGPGSRVELEAGTGKGWLVWSEGKKVTLEIEGTELKKEMPVEIEIDFEELDWNSNSLILKKTEEGIIQLEQPLQ